MPVQSKIAVPSPAQIKAGLFPRGVKNAAPLPQAWQAQVLLTPPGGAKVAGAPADELFAGILTYDATGPEALLRAQLFSLESLKYHDLLFAPGNGGALVWPLTSDPATPAAQPSAIGVALQSDVSVPAVDAVSAQFAHAGSWKSVGILSDAFSAKKTAQASTWVWRDSQSDVLRRIMNIDPSNDFAWAVLGCFYFVDFVSFSVLANSNLPTLYGQAQKPAAAHQVSMRTFAQLATALEGGFLPAATCQFADIQAILAGLSSPDAAPAAPKWTDTVQSQCYMIGQDPYPYYCQIWYDWDKGYQITVFVQKDTGDDYDARFDEFLPRGKVGPAIVYNWAGQEWDATCSQNGGGVVPMPVPNFVEVAQGKCRAVFRGSPYFGDLSIWSVALGDQNNWSDFWYWFDDAQRGVIFSLDPARSLTLIDYQSFNQNAAIDPDIFDDPTSSIPACANKNLMAVTKRPKFQ